MKLRLSLIFTLSICIFLQTFSQNKPTQKWLDQKYSMFIHFGLYSVYGGVYNGKPVTRGYSEQIQSFAGIFSDWYEATSRQFDPTAWNADSVVALAKASGMRSIVFTSKHHDGFCMYHSQYTKFNIVDATPYGRDIMKELADACHRGGIDFAVYYSLIDWHFPQSAPISSHNADEITPEHFEFNLKQIEEIMTRYGFISEIWFDMGSLTPEQSQSLYNLVDSLQPKCMISGRLGNNYVDFSVMADNEYPDYQIATPWQTAASMFNETWGYRSWQERGQVADKVKEKLESLVKVVAYGGNYLLNIGPRGDGSIVEFERNVLLDMGKWLNINAEAIYATKANPLPTSDKNFYITTKGNNLYIFLMKKIDEVALSNIKGRIQRVELLGNNRTIGFKQNVKESEIVIQLPKCIFENSLIPVLKVSFKGGYRVVPTYTIPEKQNLTTFNATPIFGHASLDYYSGYKSLTAYSWHCLPNSKVIVPTIFFTQNNIGKALSLDVEGKIYNFKLIPTDSMVLIPKGSVRFGELYTKAGIGVFGTLDEENGGIIDLTSENSKAWRKVEHFHYGQILQMELQPRRSMILLQEIIADRACSVAVKIGGGNGVYILLNGKYITAHCLPSRPDYQEELVVLHLKKGVNQLIIKNYNRFAPMLQYSLQLLDKYKLYQMSLPSISLHKGIYSVKLRATNPNSKVEPLMMNNVELIFD
ncbi:MAG: alpha-L-fucosidase [Porphyromonadaceae bacterium]|nr:alpha-L-fucosidase [Porphyromonadaceae bacterium]